MSQSLLIFFSLLRLFHEGDDTDFISKIDILLGHLLAPSKLRGGWERGKESLRSWDIETKAYLNVLCSTST